jgi:uncharacterized metal-binding protein
MPGYNTHRRFNYAVLLIVAALFYFRDLMMFDPAQFLILGAGFYAGTEFITPDLDVKSRAIKRWGVFKILWFPYMIFFEHRKSSHNIIYGAFVRLLYITAIILCVYYFLFRALPSNVMILPLGYVLIFITGIILANGLHVILDMIF